MGRRQELARLDRSLESALAGRGAMWSITGAAGVGKTRLMAELARLGSRRGFEVRWGVSTWEGQTPLFPFVQAYRIRGIGPDRPAAIRAADGELVLARADGTRHTSQEDRGRLSPDVMAVELLDVIAEAATVAPQLILIDDFHRSDPDSVRFLKLLARQVTARSILVVITHREEPAPFRQTASGSPPRLLEELRSTGILRTIELAGLHEAEMTQVAKNLISTTVPKARWNTQTLNVLVRTAGGNPFFLGELISSFLATSGPRDRPTPPIASRRAPEEAAKALLIPESIQDLLRHRLIELPRDQRRILGTAGIIGDAFSGEDITAALPTDDDTVFRVLRRMEVLEWPIRRLDMPGHHFAFQHALLREAALDLLLPSERREAAGRLAVWWRRRHPEDLESIARLSSESNRPAGGLYAVNQLIEEGIESRSLASVDRYFLWKSPMVGVSPHAREEYLASFFDALKRLRPIVGSDLGSLARRFLDLHPPEPERTITEAWYIDSVRTDDVPRATRLFEELRRRLATENWPKSSAARVHVEICELHLRMAGGDLRSPLTAARRLFRRLGDGSRLFEGVLVSEIAAICAYQHNRRAEAMFWVRRGGRIARRAGLASTVWGLGLVDVEGALEFDAGHFNRAAELSTAFARRCADQGSFRRAALAWISAGASYAELGNVASARQSYGEALKLARRWGYTGIEAGCYSSLGSRALEEHSINEAERYFRKALSLFRVGTMHHDLQLVARMGLARVYIERGELGKSKEQLDAVGPLSRRTHFRMVPELERIRARWLERSGDIRGARRLLRRSLSRTLRGPLRTQRLETLAALVHLERSAERPLVARRWERELRSEGRRAGLDAKVRILLGPSLAPSPDASRASKTLPGTFLPKGTGSTILGAGVTLSQRVLRVLARSKAVSGGSLDRDVVPPSFTQAGIAAELGISQGGLVRGLHRLVDRGEVVQVRRRVEGASRSLKAYLLTAHGAEMASATAP